MKNTTLSWIMFVLIGGTMGYLRYGGTTSPEHMQMMREYGPWLMLGIHVIIILTAFKDTVFQGILCLLVPLYSFYWLLVVADLFLFRAVVAGLLVGLGQDSAAFLQENFLRAIGSGRAWIGSGGGK